MNKIPQQLIKDYGIVCLSYIAILLFLRPAFLGEYKITESLMVVAVVHTIVLFLVVGISESIVTFLFRSPFSYSDDIVTRFQHFALCGFVCIPTLMVVLTQANVIMMHGIEHADYAWYDKDGNFTLDWLLMSRSSCIVASFIIAVAMTALSELRQMRYVLQELFQINQLLESKQQSLPSCLPKDDAADKMIPHGENRDSVAGEEKQCVLHSDYNGQDVAINPRNFIYVESVGNYANVCYIDKEQLTSTTIRTTIKQLREDLSGNDFIVQCHRGFLINLDYAESMEGANGRFFLNMFYSDKKIPVSRANKSAIKDALTALRCE